MSIKYQHPAPQYPTSTMHIKQPPPNVQYLNQRRSSVNLLLNPQERTGFYAPNRASRVALPSLSSLDLLTITYRDPGEPLPSVTIRPNNLPADPRQEFRQHGSPRCHRRSCSANSSMYPNSRSASPTLPAHSNVPYTLEQVHFIQYYREDKHFQWQAIVHPFMTQFPKVAFPMPQHQSNSAKRNKGALECRYYRAQLFPKIDDGGNIVFDQNGEVEMVNIKLRERNNHQHKDVLHDYFTLVTRCPQKVIEYSWTDEADKIEAQKIINDRSRHGIGRLPGDIIRVRPTPESIQ